MCCDPWKMENINQLCLVQTVRDLGNIRLHSYFFCTMICDDRQTGHIYCMFFKRHFGWYIFLIVQAETNINNLFLSIALLSN